MEEELKKILEQVSGLYKKYGIKSVTMDDVARELGMSKKTLYLHVTDKADLVEKVLMMENQQREELIADFEKTNLNAIEQLLEVHKYIHKMLQNFNPAYDYDLKKYYPELFNKVLRWAREQMHKAILKNIEKGKKEGLYRQNLNAGIITKLQIFRNEAICRNDIFSPEELAATETFTELFYYHVRGIASDKGIKFLERKLGKKLGE